MKFVIEDKLMQAIQDKTKSNRVKWVYTGREIVGNKIYDSFTMNNSDSTYSLSIILRISNMGEGFFHINLADYSRGKFNTVISANRYPELVEDVVDASETKKYEYNINNCVEYLEKL